jgi:hypothetical protein
VRRGAAGIAVTLTIAIVSSAASTTARATDGSSTPASTESSSSTAAPTVTSTTEAWRVEAAAGRDVAAGAARSPSVDGAHVALFRGPDGAWLYVRAPGGVVLGSAAPEFRVDGGAPFSLETMRRDYVRFGLEAFRSTPRDFAILVWPGAGPVGDPVRALLGGRELRLRFVDARGARSERTIPLTGAAAAIREALRLDGYEPSPAMQAEAHRLLTVALTRACMTSKDDGGVGRCLAAVAACGQASIDAGDLLACAIARDARVPAAWRGGDAPVTTEAPRRTRSASAATR